MIVSCPHCKRPTGVLVPEPGAFEVQLCKNCCCFFNVETTPAGTVVTSRPHIANGKDNYSGEASEAQEVRLSPFDGRFLVPSTTRIELDPAFELNQLQKRLNSAVEREDYELAAKLRDSISELKNEKANA